MEKVLCVLAIAFSCANVLAGPTSRVINGNIAQNDTHFPFAVSLQRIPPPPAALPIGTPATRNHRCGGVLVSLQHVVTAASCCFDRINGIDQLISFNTHRIFAGGVLLTTDNQAARLRPIIDIAIHPDYVPGPAHINDIAVITLAAPFLNTTVQPVNLPSGNFNPADFTNCTTAGWGGMNVTSVASVEMRWTTKVIFNQQQCTTLYSSMTEEPNIFPSMICAASRDIISASCTGDTGNGLVCGNTLTGILFRYTGCQQMTSIPELYTRVSNHTQWIQATMAGYSFTPGFFLIALAGIVHAISSKVVY